MLEEGEHAIVYLIKMPTCVRQNRLWEHTFEEGEHVIANEKKMCNIS